MHKARWKALTKGWLKVNTNGECANGGARIAYKGVIKYYKGSWIRGVASSKSSINVLSIELKGIYQGLKLVKNLGYKNIYLQFDNENALDLVEHGCLFQHDQYTLINDITKLLVEDWEVKISHVYRE